MESGDQEDWRLYRSTRNQRNKAVKEDQLKWQMNKLNSAQDPSDMWITAKSMLGWTYLGPPTQLYRQGKYVSTPSGLATTMNHFFLDKIRKLRESMPGTNYDPLSKI